MSEQNSTATVNTKDLKTALKLAIKAKRPVFIWGQYGIGKSSVVNQLCNELGGKMFDIRLSQCEMTDLRGMPYYDRESNTMQWAQPVDLPSAEEAADYPVVFLFLDELNSALPSVMASAYQLILDRKVGTYTLPENCVVIAAGNRDGDRGVTYKMPKPLSNRFIHLELKSDFDAWNEWAVGAGVHPDVVGFLNFSKDSLNHFDPKSPEHSFATPRTWEYVSDIIKDGIDSHMERILISGTVGEGTAAKFLAHRKVAADLPTPADVLAGKVTKLTTKDISAHYSLMTSMLYELLDAHPKMVAEGNEDGWHQMTDTMLGFIMENFSDEIQIMGMSMGFKTLKLPMDHAKMKNFTKFHQGAGKLFMRSLKA